MAEFVETSLGWLNLDHVLIVRYPDPVLKEAGESVVQLADGRVITCQFLGPPGQLPNTKPAPKVIAP